MFKKNRDVTLSLSPHWTAWRAAPSNMVATSNIPTTRESCVASEHFQLQMTEHQLVLICVSQKQILRQGLRHM